MIELLDVVGQVESGNDAHALRFEPALFREMPAWIDKTVPAIQSSHRNFSLSTCQMIACTSWGKFQMLGANIWGMAQPYYGTVGDFLADVRIQKAVAVRFMHNNGFDPDIKFRLLTDDEKLKFARFWNGPGAVETYAASLETAFQKLIA